MSKERKTKGTYWTCSYCGDLKGPNDFITYRGKYELCSKCKNYATAAIERKNQKKI